MVLPKLPLTGRPLADVAIYSVQHRSAERHKRPWVVRWSVDGRQRSRSYRTKAEGERFRSGLMVAVQSGEAFDGATGEPCRGSRCPTRCWLTSGPAGGWPSSGRSGPLVPGSPPWRL